MKQKKVVFSDNENQYARLVTRLRYDKLTQGSFFRELVSLYVDNDIDFAKVIAKIKLNNRTMGKKKIQKSYEEIMTGHQNKKNFALSDLDKQNIYDIIEGDFE